MQDYAKELKELRGDLTQEKAAKKIGVSLSRLQSWEQGRHTPPADKMDKARAILGGRSRVRGQVDAHQGDMGANIEHRTVRPAGAGPGQSVSGEESIVLDKRLLEGSGIDLNEHEFVRVVGSSMEPFLSHGQLVLVEPTSRVHGEDLYVYWNDMDEGHVVAMVSSTPRGLKVEKRGHDPKTMTYARTEDHLYEDEEGRAVQIYIVGRVVGSVGRPAQHIAQAEEAARHARLSPTHPIS